MTEVWAEWEEFLDTASENGWDVGVELHGGLEYAWSCELRVTPWPNSETGPDRSYMTYAVGGANPDEVLSEALTEMKVWVARRPKTSALVASAGERDSSIFAARR